MNKKSNRRVKIGTDLCMDEGCFRHSKNTYAVNVLAVYYLYYNPYILQNAT